MNAADQATRRLIAQEAAREINQIYAAFQRASPNPHMSESTFVTYFLPFFLNEVPHTLQDNVLLHWVALAGSPLTDMDIVDGAGRVLYTIPALISSEVVKQTQSGVTFGQIVQQSFDYENQSPILGQNFFLQKAAAKLNALKEIYPVPPNPIWEELRVRYRGASTPLPPKVENLAQIEFEL